MMIGAPALNGDGWGAGPAVRSVMSGWFDIVKGRELWGLVSGRRRLT